MSPPGDPTRVVGRRCVAYAVDLALVALVLVAVLLVAGDVTKLPNGCPSPVPAGRSCLTYHSTGYLIRDRALGWCALTFVLTVGLFFSVPEAIAGTSPGKAWCAPTAAHPVWFGPSSGAPPGWWTGSPSCSRSPSGSR